MKRCPKCEFIYEDDQSLSDMDGITLVFDATPLPRLQAVTDPATDFVPGANWRMHILPVVAAAILGTVMFLVYFVSTHPLASHGAEITSGSSTNVPQSIPKDAPGPTTPVPAPADAHSENSSVPDEKKEGVKADPSNANVTTDPKAESGSAKERSGTEPAKVDPESSKNPPEEKAKTTNSVSRPSSVPRRDSPRSRDSHKADSKLTSHIKTTANVLKKPFSH